MPTPTKKTHKFDIGDKVYHNGEEAIVKAHKGVNFFGIPEYLILYSDPAKGSFYLVEFELKATNDCPVLVPGSSTSSAKFSPAFSWEPLSPKEEPLKKRIEGTWVAPKWGCECGQEDKPWTKHSDWCRLYKKEN